MTVPSSPSLLAEQASELARHRPQTATGSATAGSAPASSVPAGRRASDQASELGVQGRQLCVLRFENEREEERNGEKSRSWRTPEITLSSSGSMPLAWSLALAGRVSCVGQQHTSPQRPTERRSR